MSPPPLPWRLSIDSVRYRNTDVPRNNSFGARYARLPGSPAIYYGMAAYIVHMESSQQDTARFSHLALRASSHRLDLPLGFAGFSRLAQKPRRVFPGRPLRRARFSHPAQRAPPIDREASLELHALLALRTRSFMLTQRAACSPRLVQRAPHVPLGFCALFSSCARHSGVDAALRQAAPRAR